MMKYLLLTIALFFASLATAQADTIKVKPAEQIIQEILAMSKADTLNVVLPSKASVPQERPTFFLSPGAIEHFYNAYNGGKGPVRQFILNRNGCDLLFRQLKLPCMEYSDKLPRRLVDAMLNEFYTLNLEEIQ